MKKNSDILSFANYNHALANHALVYQIVRCPVELSEQGQVTLGLTGR